ncbi:DUF4142 domain-containing protein [Legionella sainthelensi]|nr:DUF4142 domain-containing protein [Legionella sainthelensi]
MKLSKNLFIIGFIVTLGNTFCGTNSFAAPENVKNVAVTSDEMDILADIAVIDKTEIILAAVASNKKVSTGVMDFAKFLIDHHGSNLTQVLEIAHNLHFTSLNSNQANKLTTEGNEAMMKLGGLQGKQFDTAYIDAMVKGHQGALDLIDTQLMKKAKTESIKSFLINTRAAVAQHLEMAKKIQQNLQP